MNVEDSWLRKLREAVWSLYSQLKYIGEKLRKDSELVLPEMRVAFRQSGNAYTFVFAGSEYRLTYIETKKESDRWGRDKTDTTHITLMLEADLKLVFEFDLKRSVTYAPESPIFHETMGEIRALIEGPWVTSIPDLLRQMQAHSQAIWGMRNALKKAEKTKQEMTKFGF